MKVDAHYYAILAFSRACGFRKEHAWDIAYASQFVDDAKINHIVIHEVPENDVRSHLRTIDSKPCFFDMATCHSYRKIETFNYSSMIRNTAAFHFIPGCKGEHFVKRMRCKKNGIIIRNLLGKVIERGDLIELGIALHVFADTYSHQGFSGLLSKVNNIKDLEIEDGSGRILDKIPKVIRWAKDKVYMIFDKIIPAYGHGQAMSFPDLPYLAWSYSYDASDEFSDKDESSDKIDNKKRFREAFNEIEKILKKFAERHPEYTEETRSVFDMDRLFKALIVKKSDRGRIKHWIHTMTHMGLFHEDDPMLTYDGHAWLREAFSNFDRKKFSDRKVEDAKLADRFETSKWFGYYKAVQWYKAAFFACCEDIG